MDWTHSNEETLLRLSASLDSEFNLSDEIGEEDHMLTPSVCPPRPSTDCSGAVVEGLCGPDLNRGISMGFNDVGGIYNEVRAFIYQHISDYFP